MRFRTSRVAPEDAGAVDASPTAAAAAASLPTAPTAEPEPRAAGPPPAGDNQSGAPATAPTPKPCKLAAGVATEHNEWQPTLEPDLPDGAPKQVLRAASPEFMSWVLEKLGAMGANVTTLTTHDAVHGEDEKWSKQRYESSGFGYGPPGKACIRRLTMAGRTSLFYFVTQHPEGEDLRVELRARFGDDWQVKCFGRATHMLSHSWGMPFAGFISALAKVPSGSYVWNDILAINQHGDAGDLAKRDMLADLDSLKPVIQHTKRIILYWDPVDAPSPLKRVWCLYELLALITTPGFELSLGFTASGRKEIMQMAEAFAMGRKGGDKDKLKQGAQKLERAIKVCKLAHRIPIRLPHVGETHPCSQTHAGNRLQECAGDRAGGRRDDQNANREGARRAQSIRPQGAGRIAGDVGRLHCTCGAERSRCKAARPLREGEEGLGEHRAQRVPQAAEEAQPAPAAAGADAVQGEVDRSAGHGGDGEGGAHAGSSGL